MFVIQPGQGLSFTASREIALGLGGFEVAPPVIPPVIPPVDGGGRGSGRTEGIHPMGYTKHHEDNLAETRRKRILQEDDDIVEIIIAMLTGGLK